MRNWTKCLPAIGLAALSAIALGAAAKAQDITIAYHTTYKCPADTGTGPGTSPDNPIVLEAFDEARDAAVDAVEQAADSGKGDGLSSYECKWVKLSGYFRWTDYYSYRGRLYGSANRYYFDHGASYLIEDFADPAARRSEFQATQIEIVGQFYQLCAHAPGADMVFGPCHYGGYQGMMLNDVRVLSVAADRFQILTGEANRPLVDDLVEAPANSSDRRIVEKSARDWLRSITGGEAEYRRHLTEHFPKVGEKEKAEPIEPDSWLAALLDPNSKVSRLGKRASRLPLKIFYQKLETEQKGPDYWATACFCLEGDCRDRWPLFQSDSEHLQDRFICLELEKNPLAGDDAPWLWSSG